MGTPEWWQVAAALAAVAVTAFALVVKLIRDAFADQLASKDARIAQLEEALRLFSAAEVQGQFESMQSLIVTLKDKVESLTDEVGQRLSHEDLEALVPEFAKAIREPVDELVNRERIIMLAMREQLELYREETGRNWTLNIPHDAFQRSAEVREEMERRLFEE